MLVDTDVIVDAARGVGGATALLEQYEAASPLAISAITEMELVVGCRDRAELRHLDRFLRRFRIAPLTPRVSAEGARLVRRYRLSHGLLIPDALIAATAMDLSLPLLTGNHRDFRFIPDLNLVVYRP